jgi:hypothetical protein
MNLKRPFLLAFLAALAFALVPPVEAATHSGRAVSRAPAHAGGGSHPGPGGWHRHYYGPRYGWGWAWGLGIGVPLALGWYDPFWGPPYYPYYGPAYRAYGYPDPCAGDEECWRARQAPAQPPAPTTEAPPPPAPPALGSAEPPTQRPLHLNYCDSAKAWYPQVKTCPGGWRLIRPDYN